MAVSLRDPQQAEFLAEILQYPTPANAMEIEYLVGSRDLSDVVAEAEWGRTDDERPAQELILRVKESLDPEEIRNENVYVYLNIADMRIRQFQGQVLTVAAGRARTEIRAVTAGYWLDKQRFPANSTVSYADVAPSEVVYDCVRRMTRYDLAWMDLEEVSAPKFKAISENVFDSRNMLADPIGQAVTSAELFFIDSSFNAPILSRDRSPAEAVELLYEYVVGEDIDPDEFIPEIAGDEYYSVVATTEVNGKVEDLFEPIIIPDSTAPEDAVYGVEVSDGTTTAGKDAHQLAVEAANRFAMGGASVSFNVDWIHPLMVDGDFISILEPFDYNGVSGHRRWVAKVIRQRKTHEKIHLFESVEMVKIALVYDKPRRVPQLTPTPPEGSGGGNGDPEPEGLAPSNNLAPSNELAPSG
jgi:hypothetical protein